MLKLSGRYYYDIQTHGPEEYDFDAVYIDFYPKDVWDAETRIPYIFENDVYRKDIASIKKYLLDVVKISSDMIENDNDESFSFYILDPSTKDEIVKNISNESMLEFRELPILHDEIPDAHRVLYHLQMVAFKPTENGAAATEEEQLAVFIVPKSLLQKYLEYDNCNFDVLNRLKWTSLDHRFTFSMQTAAKNNSPKKIAFDMLDTSGILFPCYPEDIEEILPTDDFCNDIDLIRSIFNRCGMIESRDLESLAMTTSIQLGLAKSFE